MSILDREVVVVMGKGGVGRTTAACVLALRAAAAGKRVCIAEMAGVARVPEIFGLPGRSYAPQPCAPGVDTMSLSAMDALHEFGMRRLRVKALVRMVFGNRVTHAFLDAVPGLPDMQQLGKIRHLLEEPDPGTTRYDLVIIDAPATGHGLTMLHAARSLGEMTRVGPFYEETQLIERLLGNPQRTALVLVTLGEPLPVNESLELAGSLGEDRNLLAHVIANQVRNPHFPTRPGALEMVDALRSSEQSAAAEIVSMAAQRFEAQESCLAQLERQLQLPVWRLPHVATVDAASLQELSTSAGFGGSA